MPYTESKIRKGLFGEIINIGQQKYKGFYNPAIH